MLMTHLLDSTICAGVAALIALALRNSAARTRHSIWLIASLKFLIPLSLFVSIGRQLGANASALALEPVSHALQWLDRSLPQWRFNVAVSAGDGDGPAGAWIAVLFVWASSALILAAWRWRQWRSLSRLVRHSTPLDSGREAEALGRTIRRARRPRRINIVRHEARLEPGVVGIITPTLLWPSGLSDRLSDDELAAVLAHEACHVDRRDNLGALCQVIVETLFWFHPLVWWIGRQLVHERERACDEEVLEMGTKTEHYAKSIVNVCGFCLSAPAAFVAGISGSPLASRIERILTWRSAAAPAWLRLLPLLLAIATAAIPMAAGAASAIGPDTVQNKEEVYKPSKDVTKPSLVKETKPKYTKEAMQAKIQGNVKLEAVVLKDGKVGDVKIVKSLDTVHGLDDEAVKAMKQWEFTPGTKDKKPVAVQIEVEMTFTLK
jgi:bla regulator protein BlaR1